jgi:hypothetical protein
MANTFTSAVKQHWEAGLQRNLEKHLVAMELATMKIIADGTVLNIPRMAFQSVGTYTKYTNVTVADLTTANDTLTIDTTQMITFAMDKIDMGDNYINIIPKATSNAGYKLKQAIDGAFLNQYSFATNIYNVNGLNGAAGAPVVLATGASQNLSAVFGDSQAKLINDGANISDICLVVDAVVLNTINTLGLENGFQVADEAYTNKVARGYKGRFLGMEVYLATNLTTTAVLDLATQPTAGDTVTIAGQVFTFVASIGTTAGNVLIGASVDATRVSLAALINTPGTTTANGVALTDPSKFANFITAVDSPGGDTLTVTSKSGRFSPTSVMTNAANDWQAEIIHCIMMEKGSIYMALRNNVTVDERDEPLKLVTNYLIYTRYGITTPQEGKDRMVDLQIQATAAQA